MAQIISMQDAENAAKNLGEKIEAARDEQKSVFENLMSEIEKVNPSMGGFEELGMLLSLPDEQFSLIAPIFIAELEKSFNNVNDKMLLVQAMNLSGTKAEDIQEAYQQLMIAIDDEFNEAISPAKRSFLKQMLGITFNSIADAQGVSKRIVEIPIEICNPQAKLPTYAHVDDAGMDVYALDDYEILPGETKLIPLGLKVAIPYGYEIQVRPKSGRSLKEKLRIANTPGTIDSGYRDELGVIVENIASPIQDIEYEFDENGIPIIKSILHGEPFYIHKGEKFAQLVLNEIPRAAFYEVTSVADLGENRQGGFGSTGLK